MKLIDWYIFRKFIGTFFFVLALIMMIAIVFDISEKIEDFISKGASMEEIIFDYYLNFLAFYGNTFSSLIVFISTILFASRMTARTEIVAILTSGVSFRRMMWPFFLGAVVIFGLNYYMSHYVIPKTNISRITFENTYINNPSNSRFQNIYRQIRPGVIIYLENFNDERQSGYHFSMEKFNEGKLFYKLKADFLRYDSVANNWRLDNWEIRRIAENGAEEFSRGRQFDTTFSFQPDELVPKLYTVAMMETPVLEDFISAERVRGSSNINFYLVEKFRRTAYPASTFILVLIAVSLSTKKTRGGMGLNIAVGFFI
ncbi:MAG: LptF/LptG family permease, partial [Bacteroidota bacterium]|nr:LptF/LptG family permease [Bacteroidota bacterium]